MTVRTSILAGVGIAVVAIVASTIMESQPANSTATSLLGGAGASISKLAAQYYSSDSYGSYDSDDSDGLGGLSYIIAAGLGLIPASIAQKKGRSFGLWWFYGWMLFIIALIHSLLMKPKGEAAIAAAA